MTDVMEWIETVLMEIKGTKQSIFDIEYSKVNLELDSVKITTTTRTTDLVKVMRNLRLHLQWLAKKLVIWSIYLINLVFLSKVFEL